MDGELNYRNVLFRPLGNAATLGVVSSVNGGHICKNFEPIIYAITYSRKSLNKSRMQRETK